METRRMCPHCRAFITTKDRVCPYCNEAVAPRRVERGSSGPILGGWIPQAGYLTILILLICSGLYLATALYSSNSGNGNFVNIDGQTLFIFGADLGRALAGGQWWRLVTAGFLHGGILHILMNMWVLFDLGAQIETIYGGARMLAIYFVSNVVGFYVSAMWHPGTVSAGASAALFGLVGAMLALGVRYRGSGAGDMIRAVYGRYLVYLLIFSLLPGVDMAAHIGGLAGGFGLGYVAGRPEYEQAPVERVWQIAAALSVLATLYSFLKWYLWFSSPGQ
jgi:rhomboid protease GluP